MFYSCEKINRINVKNPHTVLCFTFILIHRTFAVFKTTTGYLTYPEDLSEDPVELGESWLTELTEALLVFFFFSLTD